jgi:hypothetical protein
MELIEIHIYLYMYMCTYTHTHTHIHTHTHTQQVLGSHGCMIVKAEKTPVCKLETHGLGVIPVSIQKPEDQRN